MKQASNEKLYFMPNTMKTGWLKERSVLAETIPQR